MGIKSIVKEAAEKVTTTVGTKVTNTADTIRGGVAIRKSQKEVLKGVGQRLREKKAAEKADAEAEKAKKAALEAAEKAGLTIG